MAAESTEAGTKTSRKPKETRFKQQRLPAWQPVMSAHTVLPVLFAVGIGFIPLGIGFLISALNVQELVIDYTTTGCVPNCGEFIKNLTAGCEPNCTAILGYRPSCQCNVSFTVDKPFESQVYMYYSLSGYYQNLRRYVKSRDDYQLRGDKRDFKGVDGLCKPFSGVKSTLYDLMKQQLNDSAIQYNDSIIEQLVNSTIQQLRGVEVSIPYAPCGAIANSMFTDTFNLYYHKDDDTEVPVSLTSEGITWSPDINSKYKFKNPTDYNASIGKMSPDALPPPSWPLPLNEMLPNGYKSEDFIVWMRTAALPTFRKLYRRVVHGNSGGNSTGNAETFAKGLPAGNYTVTVNYNYRVLQFNGRKRIILSTTSFLGGKNPFLGIAYIIVGAVCLIAGIILLIIHLRVGKSSTGVREEQLHYKTPYYDLRTSVSDMALTQY